MSRNHNIGPFLLLALVAGMPACVSVPKRNPVPEQLVEQAEVPNLVGARVWGDELPADIGARIELIRDQLRTSGFAATSDSVSFLTMSGGGANGAFGAGLLKGWTESGERPEFLIVTGISTGALIAPYAFLGSEYDDELQALYTGIKTSDILKRRALLFGLASDAMSDTSPLRDLLKKHVDRRMVDAVAREYHRGRRLLIGTTNIDTKRPVIWDIGRISTQGTETSRQLIRDIMLASASIPGLFPPVRIAVEADREIYDELHVDGGTSRQVFLHSVPVSFREAAEDLGIEKTRNLYVVRNAILTPRWSAVEPRLLPLLGASVSTLIRSQGLGDIYRIYLGAVRDGTQFKLASVPADFQLTPNEDFDTEYMKLLFELAYDSARNGYDWATFPPGIEVPAADRAAAHDAPRADID